VPGVGRLVIPQVIEDRKALADLCRVVPGAAIVVCRLVAGPETLRDRIGRRESGSSRESLIRRAHELAVSLDENDVADFVVHTDGRRLDEIALEVLTKVGWIDEMDGLDE
jgi:hypothetical protein